MTAPLNNLLYFFDRPAQPIFRPRGGDSNTIFDVPANYYIDRYKPIASQLQTRGPNTNIIPVKEITVPDISVAASLDKRALFSVFNPFHREAANNLINVLMNIGSLEDFQSALVYIQPRVNPYLFIYCLSVAVIHRNDTRNFRLPSHACSFPELYVDGAVLAEVRASGTLVSNGSRTAIEIPRDFTASDSDVEHRLAYFREDIGINLHHWHWHLVYPTEGPLNIVNKDRRGELFYYMHQQILARYNIERFCNDLVRVGRFNSYRDPIPEGYFPKLDSIVASRVWPPRQANVALRDVYRELDQMICTVDDLERWRDRIYEVIHRGAYYRGNDLVPLSENDGIDVVGNMVESSIVSPNRVLYGNLHNQGHNMISYVHDPDGRFLESTGVMFENTTAMRDPVFYRWHNSIQDIFEAYKNTLTPYTTQQLSFDGVTVTQAEIIVEGSRNNTLQTFWQRSQLDLSRGLDFVPTGPVFATFTHLQHSPFSYRITVQNSGAQRVGTVRIFLGPKNDERGLPLRFREQRWLFIEMDRFTTTLRAGSNTIERRSIESSVTAPFEQTFRSLDNAPLTGEEAQNFNYCGCGWPDHMLVPRGTRDGYPCSLFVMISNYQDDRVENSSMDNGGGGCDNAVSFCGVRNSRYPDRRPMGFPFDRLPRAGAPTINQFLTPNMRVQDVVIRFTDRIVNGPTVTSTQAGTATQGGTNTNTQGTQQTRPTSNTANQPNRGTQQPQRRP
ncbi:phenoloxidase 1-like [Planococcus citri]|uniref:phenoloxidase 1-like n=1 Tax=Planococcus citri TaxID=170843 RepID=UPI0031F9742F